MITITPCKPSDNASVVALWSQMAQVAESCWYQAAPLSVEALADFQASGLVVMAATSNEEVVGFGFWRPAGDRLRLGALAAETAEVYYRLMVSFCDWGLANEMSEGWAEISPRATREKGWMDALAAVVTEPIGRGPMVEGQNPALRTIELLRVTAGLSALRAAALDELGS